jgi:hypothetical protein
MKDFSKMLGHSRLTYRTARGVAKLRLPHMEKLHKQSRIIRYVEPGTLPARDLLSLYDKSANLLIVDRDHFERLSDENREIVLRTKHPALLLRLRREAKRGCHKRAEGSPEGADLHKHRAEASGFDGNARLGRTRHKERTPCGGSIRFERTDGSFTIFFTSSREFGSCANLHPGVSLAFPECRLTHRSTLKDDVFAVYPEISGSKSSAGGRGRHLLEQRLL